MPKYVIAAAGVVGAIGLCCAPVERAAPQHSAVVAATPQKTASPTNLLNVTLAFEAVPALIRVSENRSPSEFEKLAIYFEEIQKLTDSERLQEYELVRDSFNRDRGEFARLQLALLVSLPDAPFYDLARARGLTEFLLRDRSSPSRLRAFAYLIGILLEQQQRTEDNAHELSASLANERTRNQALEQKLEALKTLEKSLLQRDTAPIPKSNERR